MFISCDDIERDNILDPKNPISERPQIVTVEAFVNTNDTLPNQYNNFMLNALNDLETFYSDKITIVEHHRKINGQYDDGYVLTNSELLYDIYFQGFSNGVKGVPDVFINGTEARVQGASSSSSALYRLQQVIDNAITANSFFTIEPKITSSGNNYMIKAKIARLGSTDAEDLLLKAIVIRKFDNLLLKRVVTHILKSQEIQNISNGESKEIDLGELAINQDDADIVFMITSNDELQVFQSIKVDLN